MQEADTEEYMTYFIVDQNQTRIMYKMENQNSGKLWGEPGMIL
jgi:hypothetical protein